MIPEEWRNGEVAVIGLGKSGVAATQYLTDRGIAVYASDVGDAPAVRAASAALQDRGASVDVGRHDLDRIARATAVVVSPGVPPDAEPLEAARNAGVSVHAELDVAALALSDSKLIVVTGTNGKSTTTALIAHVLAHAGVHARAAGNIGYPLIAVAAEEAPPPWIVVEASSFQLHDAPHLRPNIGVVTNLSPDHLDRYASTEEYYADKQNLFRNASAQSVWILNGDDPEVLRLPAGAPGLRQRFSLRTPDDAWYDRRAGCLMLGAKGVLLERSGFALLGDHNVANGLAAALAARAVGVSVAAVRDGLGSFRPLAHRLEPVAEIDGVLWINDSKATNVASTEVALRAMGGPYVLIAGGKPKGDSYGSLVDALGQGCRMIVAYGEARGRIAEELGAVVPVVDVERFADAVSRAREAAAPGDTVLVSPAAASFDQFRSYEERGEVLKHLLEVP